MPVWPSEPTKQTHTKERYVVVNTQVHPISSANKKLRLGFRCGVESIHCHFAHNVSHYHCVNYLLTVCTLIHCTMTHQHYIVLCGSEFSRCTHNYKLFPVDTSLLSAFHQFSKQCLVFILWLRKDKPYSFVEINLVSCWIYIACLLAERRVIDIIFYIVKLYVLFSHHCVHVTYLYVT